MEFLHDNQVSPVHALVRGRASSRRSEPRTVGRVPRPTQRLTKFNLGVLMLPQVFLERINMTEKEKEYMYALVKSVSIIQDCLFDIAKRLEKLEGTEDGRTQN